MDRCSHAEAAQHTGEPLDDRSAVRHRPEMRRAARRSLADVATGASLLRIFAGAGNTTIAAPSGQERSTSLAAAHRGMKLRLEALSGPGRRFGRSGTGASFGRTQ